MKAFIVLLGLTAGVSLQGQSGSDPSTGIVFKQSVIEQIESWHRLPPTFDGSGISQIELLNLTEYSAIRQQITEVDQENNVTKTTLLIENTDPVRSPEIGKIVSDENGVRSYNREGKEITNFPLSEMGMAAYNQMQSFYIDLLSTPESYGQSPLLSSEAFQSLNPDVLVTSTIGSAYSYQPIPGMSIQIDPELKQEVITLYNDGGQIDAREVTVYCEEIGLQGLPCFKEEINYNKLSDGTCFEHVTRYIYSDYDLRKDPVMAEPRESSSLLSPIVNFNNPVNGTLNLTLLHFDQNVNVQLSSIHGQSVKNWVLPGHQTRGTMLDLVGIPAGVYVLSTSDGKQVRSYKIILQ